MPGEIEMLGARRGVAFGVLIEWGRARILLA